jgi:hypothetical protein
MVKNKHQTEIQSKQSFSRLIGRGILRVLYLFFFMSDFKNLATVQIAQHFLRLGVLGFFIWWKHIFNEMLDFLEKSSKIRKIVS